MPRSKMLIVAWSLWGVLLLGVLYMSARLATERTSSPEAGPGLGVFLILLLLGVLAGLAGLLVWAGRRQSSGGLILLTILLAYPLVMLIAQPIIIGYKQYRWDREDARHGDFRDRTLAAMRSFCVMASSIRGCSGPEFPMHVVQPKPTTWKPS